jgi:superfamily II DNA or RNA helicase
MELRDYQSDTIYKIKVSLSTGHKRPCVQAPTGAGKTVIAAAIIKSAREKGKRVMFVVPMLSLIDQTVERFVENGIHEIGVMQGQHEMTDPLQPVQVCSMQTLMRRELPDVDLVIIDEAHVQFKFMHQWLAWDHWKHVPFIGLTATPWARGMGKVWDDLIVATTTAELIDKGVLSQFKVYAPAHPDLTGVRTKAGDYHEQDLAEAMDKGALVADIVSTWLERGENRSTVCFAVNRVHAKHIQEQFEATGIPSAYMDAFTPMEERLGIVKAFAVGDIRVICNVGVLTTGFDADVRCIILARPTKSEILYTQMIGRGLRTASGKDHCLILDHSDTTIRLGFVTDIHYEELDDGKQKKKSHNEKSEVLPKECPKCTFLRPAKVRQCPSCGFEAVPINKVESISGELYELTRDKKIKSKDWPIKIKQEWYSQLILHAQLKGYKRGWAYHAYRNKFGVAPANSLLEQPSERLNPEVQSWIRHYNLVKAKMREKLNGKQNAVATN